MKLSGARLRGFLARPDPAVCVALVYGPDSGLVRERAHGLITAVAGSPPDPFRLAELAADVVKADPVRLADEAMAMAFGGGRRAVLVRDAGDVLTPAVRNLLGLNAQDAALTVLEGGELGKRSSLRQLCETAPAAAAIACYEDTSETLRQVIRETLGADGLSASPAALDYLAHSLGVDRGITRNELAKLATYMGAGMSDGMGGGGNADRRAAGGVELEDARAVIDDGHGASLSGIAFAATGGDVASLDRALDAAWREGLSPIALLRATANHLQRLLAARAAIDGGRSPAQAMAALRPPVLFFHQEAFRRDLGRWNAQRLAAALSRLIEAELSCKSTGAPQRLICSRVLLSLAGAVPAAAGTLSR